MLGPGHEQLARCNERIAEALSEQDWKDVAGEPVDIQLYGTESKLGENLKDDTRFSSQPVGRYRYENHTTGRGEVSPTRFGTSRAITI